MQSAQDITALSRNTSIGHYKIREVINIDGVNITYKAWDTERIRLVVIKEYFPDKLVSRTQNSSNIIILNSKTDVFKNGLENFLNQTKNLALLDHPNIIKVHDCFTLNNTAYQCLPFELGQSLNQLLDQQDKTLPEETFKSIFEAILTGLEYIHKHNFRHNKIALDNIFLRNKGEPLLINFDVTQQSNSFNSNLEDANPIDKTPKDLDYSSDIYALGVAMYQCISNKVSIDIDEGNDEPLTPASEIGHELYSTQLLQFIDWLITPEKNNHLLNASLILNKLKSGLSEFQAPPFQPNTDTIDRSKSIDNIEVVPEYNKEANNSNIKNGAINSSTQTATSISTSESDIVDTASLVFTIEQTPLTEQENAATVDINPYIESLVTTKNRSAKPKRWLVITGLCLFLLSVIAFSQKKHLQWLFTSQKSSVNKTIDLDTNSSALSNKPQNSNEVSHKSSQNSPLNSLEKKQLENIIQNRANEELAKSNQQIIKQQKTVPVSKPDQIKALLEKAENDVKQLRLSTPKGNNAIEKYKKVLQLAPDNKTAQDGINTIVEKYLQLVKKTRKHHHYGKARHYLDKAKTIQPSHPAIAEAEKFLITDNFAYEQEQTLKQKKTITTFNAKTPLKIDMVWINPDCFQMGDNDIYSAEHKVCLTKGYYLGKYEVTQSQWQQVMGNNSSAFIGNNKPVQNISWNNVQIFIYKLNELTGKNYRLPTEAEWEYACRSGGKKMKFCGSNNANRVAWYKENADNKIHPIGQKQPNGLGLYDMSGNVWEWTQDFYKVDYYNNSPVNNPKGPIEGSGRVVRGGSWFSGKSVLRSAYRVWYAPSIRVSYLGFRLAK